jgi:hypothetical protein
VSTRRDLRPDDLDELQLAHAWGSAERPPRIFRVMETLTADVIGHRLFTIMRFDPKRDEVERVYTSMPAVYPIGGRKKKSNTTWSDHVLRDGRVFRANTPESIRAAFDDHTTITSLGLGSVLNIPVMRKLGPHDPGTCIGTMNLLHEVAWYTEQNEALGARLSIWLALAVT